MKAAWLASNLLGLGLPLYGAIYAMEDKAGVGIVMAGMCCMAISVQLRKRVFRRR